MLLIEWSVEYEPHHQWRTMAGESVCGGAPRSHAWMHHGDLNCSNNINQLARQANATSEFPAEAHEALKHIRSVAMRIDDAIDGLM